MSEETPAYTFRGSLWDFPTKDAEVADVSTSPGCGFYVIGLRLLEETVLKSVEKQEQEPASESLRVNRGSSWLNVPQFARVARRFNDTPGLRYNSLGFRLVEEVD